MQTTPSRLTIWISSYAGLLAIVTNGRDDLTLRGILAAQENLKAREAAQRPASRAFFFPCICQDPLADLLTHAQSLNEPSGVGKGASLLAPWWETAVGAYASALAVTVKVVLAGMSLEFPQKAPLLLA